MFNPALALEMLALRQFAEIFPSRDRERDMDPVSSFLSPSAPERALEIDGAAVRSARGLVEKRSESDVECFVANSVAGDLVVAFRSTETGLFGNRHRRIPCADRQPWHPAVPAAMQDRGKYRLHEHRWPGALAVAAASGGAQPFSPRLREYRKALLVIKRKVDEAAAAPRQGHSEGMLHLMLAPRARDPCPPSHSPRSLLPQPLQESQP